jgi:hypothetical protein
MTTEELKIIRNRWADIRFMPSYPASQVEVLKLCDEVEAYKKKLDMIHRMAHPTNHITATAEARLAEIWSLSPK